ncbi:MAG: ABC transporter ATP-binding protein [Polyangiaceae bacterium]
MGPSGSAGAPTNLIGLLDRPTSGSDPDRRPDMTGLDDRGTPCFARRCYFVFQFHHLVGSLTAVENLMMPLSVRSGRMREEDRARAQAVLEDVGLGARANAKPRELSGGQQQRVAIARALVHEPLLVLADEPTGNLDTSTADDIFALLRRFNRERALTFLIVTHDPRLAARCDRIITLVDGRVSTDVSSAETTEPPTRG